MTTPAEWRERLLGLARSSIEHGLEYGRSLPVCLEEWPEALQRRRSSFVTLRLQRSLRGCVGALRPTRALVLDVAGNAFAAAYRDPRFPPVTRSDCEGLEIHLSLLSPVVPLKAHSEAELLRQLRPGIDGLVFQDGGRHGTFLPSVWRSLPEPREFLAQLKVKAGLPGDYWSETVRTYRYTVEEF